MNKQFEEWYWKKHSRAMGFGFFNKLPFSMQWGVYLEFFDSVGVFISDYPNSTIHKVGFSFKINGRRKTTVYNTRTEAQKEAIKKAFEILES